MILLSHPSVDGRVQHTANALSRAGVLGEFWTYSDQPPSLQRVPHSSLMQAGDQGCDDIPLCCGSENPAVRSMATSLDAAMSVRLDFESFRAVYAYEGGADVTFQAAAKRGVLRIYDRLNGGAPSQHPILEEEAGLEPEWASPLHDSTDWRAHEDRLDSELRQADLVLVASTFGLSTLEHQGTMPAAIAVVVPGAAPAPSHSPSPTRRSGRLRVLYSGPLDQRAGLPYLFRACRELGNSVALTVIGTPPTADCPALLRELTHVRWLPTWSQAVIREEMAAHDVFLHPSVFDTGSCMLLEALSMGLPIVATTHSAAPDLISDKREGFIIPPRSSADIVDRLALLQRDPDLRAAMAREARQRADAFTWQRYEKTIAATVGAAIGMR